MLMLLTTLTHDRLLVSFDIMCFFSVFFVFQINGCSKERERLYESCALALLMFSKTFIKETVMRQSRKNAFK